jgi:hypothetical protein
VTVTWCRHSSRRPSRPPATAAEARGDPSNHITEVTGSPGWTGLEVTAQVGFDASMILFGIFLTGRGRVVLRRAELTRVPLSAPASQPETHAN